MDKKQIIIIGLLVVVCILIASIAITLNNQTIANNTTKVANNTTEAVVDSVTQDESSSQEQPYSARFENSEYQYNPSTDTYTKDGSGSYIYDYGTGEWTSTSSGQWMGSTQSYFDENVKVSENGDVSMM